MGATTAARQVMRLIAMFRIVVGLCLPVRRGCLTTICCLWYATGGPLGGVVLSKHRPSIGCEAYAAGSQLRYSAAVGLILKGEDIDCSTFALVGKDSCMPYRREV